MKKTSEILEISEVLGLQRISILSREDSKPLKEGFQSSQGRISNLSRKDS
jgi:hypothetical protein